MSGTSLYCGLRPMLAACAIAALLAGCANQPTSSGARELMIVGNDEKVTWDESGKQVSTRVFPHVEPVGSTGFFAVPNDGGLGMTSVYDSNMNRVRVDPSYDLNKYLQGVDFKKELSKSEGIPGPRTVQPREALPRLG